MVFFVARMLRTPFSASRREAPSSGRGFRVSDFLYTKSAASIKSIGRHFFFNLNAAVFLYMILTKPTLRAFIDLNHLQHVSLFVLCADCVIH